MKNLLKFAFSCVMLWILSFPFVMISSATESDSLYQPKGRRDPFVQLVAAGSAQKTGSLLAVEMPEDLVVEGIACDPLQGCIVIANGTVLKEGEGAGNVKAVKIKQDGALFTVNEVEVFKPVYQEDSKMTGSAS